MLKINMHAQFSIRIKIELKIIYGLKKYSYKIFET